MPGHRDHLRALIGAHHAAAVHPGGQQAGRDAEGVQHRFAPRAGPHVQHLAGGGNGGFADLRAAQGVSKQIRHKEQPPCLLQQLRLALPQRQQLEQRVDGHDLVAGGGIQLRFRQNPPGQLHHALGTAVPVVDRVAQQVAPFVQQAKVHTPGIKADALKLPRLFHAQVHIGHQRGKIPAEMAR